MRRWGDRAAPNATDGSGKPCPPTAQFALRQGRTLARNICRALKGKDPEPFHFESLGSLCVVGHQTPPAPNFTLPGARGRSLRFSGPLAWSDVARDFTFPSWPGWSESARVLLDWTFETFFPQAISSRSIEPGRRESGMVVSDFSAVYPPAAKAAGVDGLGIFLAVAVGAAGGGLAAAIGQTPIVRQIGVGIIFGFGFATALRGRATSPGAGLIWGLGAGLMLWIVLPAVGKVLLRAGYSPDAMLGEARARFPELVGCLTLVGAPVGLVGSVTELLALQPAGDGRNHFIGAGPSPPEARPAWPRPWSSAYRWMYEGDFYPLDQRIRPVGHPFRDHRIPFCGRLTDRLHLRHAFRVRRCATSGRRWDGAWPTACFGGS